MRHGDKKLAISAYFAEVAKGDFLPAGVIREAGARAGATTAMAAKVARELGLRPLTKSGVERRRSKPKVFAEDAILCDLKSYAILLGSDVASIAKRHDVHPTTVRGIALRSGIAVAKVGASVERRAIREQRAEIERLEAARG